MVNMLRLQTTDALFLDFDGTLVGFADTPEAVEVSQELRTLLTAWHSKLNGALALISGRELSSLQRHVDLPLPMAGSHGAEWWYGTGQVQSLSLINDEFRHIKQQLKILAQQENLLLEDKGKALAIHFRQQPEKEQRLDSYLDEILFRFPSAKVRLIKGNCVRELQPLGVDKGVALARFMQTNPFKDRRPVYLGDDTTDEDAFAWVNMNQGLSIKVGEGPSCARARMNNPGEVFAFLKSQLIKLDG